MAIPGWPGATRIVDGRECPEVRIDEHNGRFHFAAVMMIGGGRAVISADRRARDEYSCFPDDLAALNALAAAHGGCWRATPDDDRRMRCIE